MVASNRSSTIDGNGTSMTKTRLTAAIGTIHSMNGLRPGIAVVMEAGVVISVGLLVHLRWQRGRVLARGKQPPEFQRARCRASQECFVRLPRCGKACERAADFRPSECFPSAQSP